MKTLIISAFLLCSVAFSINATASIKKDSAKQSALSQLLPMYYDIKNALVNTDPKVAADKANTFLQAVNNIDTKTLSPAEQKAFVPLQAKLAYDAEHISKSMAVEHQREHFESLSLNFSALAQAVKLSDQPIYQQYCPMKKAYWLSSEAAIKNPYYGKTMMTCGKVSATYKK